MSARLPTPYRLKPGRLSSHGRILQLAASWPKTSQILEVGTATGYLGRELYGQGLTALIGLEEDPRAAEQARPFYQALHVLDLEEARDLSWLGRFDVVICADVLEHLRDPLHQLRRLVALLRPGGHVIISLPNMAHWTVRLMLLGGHFDYAERGLLDRGHLRFFTYKTAYRMVEQAGLRIKQTFSTPIPFSEPIDRRVPQWASEWADRLYNGVTRCWKTLFAYQFVFLAMLAENRGLPIEEGRSAALQAAERAPG